MKWEITKDKPLGAITCTKEYTDILKLKGWVVDFHTEGYANFIGFELNGLSIGFCCWMSNLEITVGTPEVGFYNDSWEGNIDVKNQKDLNIVIKIIGLFGRS